MKRLGVFLLVLGASTLFNRADLSSVDEGFVYKTTAALVDRLSWRMDEDLSGRRYSRFSPLPSLFAAPFYAVARVLPVGIGDHDAWGLAAACTSSCVVTAWTAVAIFGFLRMLRYSEVAAATSTLLWAFGTLAFPYSSTLFHQVTATLLLVYVCQYAFEGRPFPLVVAAALLTSLQLTLAATVFPLALRQRGIWSRPTLVGLLLGTTLGVGLNALVNWLRGDQWLIGAYETETFTTPTFVGAVGLFFSAGKGLLWFAPLAFVGLLMLVPLAQRRPEIGRPLLAAVACHCVVVVHWWAWHGSLTWGPRLLLPILPLLLVPIADLIDRRREFPSWQLRGLGSIAAVSVLVNVWAATQPMIEFLFRIPDGSASEWIFVPSLSPLSHWCTPAQHLYGSPFASWLCFLIVVVGALMTNHMYRNVWPPHSIAPWRAILLAAVPLAPMLWDNYQSHPFPQRRNLEPKDGTPMSAGELRFPIRGQYRLEWGRGSEGEIRIGQARLSRRNPLVVVEAPPMSLPIQFIGQAPDLYWTIPGEGQFRVPIPVEYLTSNAKRAETEWRVAFRHYSWLLYLLAVPLYFDWLLDGRRMKEPADDGKEANP